MLALSASLLSPLLRDGPGAGGSSAWAEAPRKPGVLPVAPLPDKLCDGPLGARWAFALPAAPAGAPAEDRGEGGRADGGGCEPGDWRVLPATAADEVLPRAPADRPVYFGLRRDGSTVPVQVIAVAQKAERRRLLCRPADPEGGEAGDGGVPDGGAGTGDQGVPAAMAAPRTKRPAGRPRNHHLPRSPRWNPPRRRWKSP
jgi:hypothetical protein